ncbi:MAG TPA: hypothetical protein DEP84_32920 [Chloroflexi bacterium]|nr:hypothetical protein [Chloroflexota bacterium]
MLEARREGVQLSPLNSIPEVRQVSQVPPRVILHDVTLRDGEQTPGVVFEIDTRLQIARALDALGVQRIEAGFPVTSLDDREGVAAVANAGLRAEVWGFGRCLPSDVEVNASCAVRQVILEISVSDLKMAAYGLTRERVIRRMREALARAQDLGLKVAFMPVDLTRADLNFAEQIITEAVEKGGADEIVVVDTIGVTTPEAIGYLTDQIRNWVGVPLAVHCHNDFGLALANSIAALKAGAHCVHVSINCLGERAGNVDLAEVVATLEFLYGADTGVRTERLAETAQLVEELSGLRLSLSKPVVGRRIFTRESGGVVQQLLTSPPSVEPYEPALVGLERAVILGKKSGRFSIIHTMERLGLEATEPQIEQVLTRVKEFSIAHRRAITDDEFRTILGDVLHGV